MDKDSESSSYFHKVCIHFGATTSTDSST